MTKLQAYHGDAKLKSDFIKQIKWHAKQDSVQQGTYGRENGVWKGCAVACSLRSLAIINKEELKVEYNVHKDYESKLGIPQELAHLEDRIFEGLPIEDAKKWPLQFAQAIEQGSDLSMVATKFKIWLLDEKNDVYKNAFPDGKKAIKMVVKVLKNFVKTGKWDESARSAAESAAWLAAESAAESAAWLAAESAAESAAWSAAWLAVESANYKKQAKILLTLLKSA